MSDVFADFYNLAAGSGDEDADGDGQTNAEESQWGTDPNDPDVCGITKIERLDSETIRVTMPTVTGKRYRFSISLELQDWEPIGDEFLGTGGLEHLLVDFPTVGAEALFWRVNSLGEVDADGDGLGAYEESLLGTSDELPDSDGDKVSDKDEFEQGTVPLSSASEDGDMIPDDWEIFYGLDITPGVDSSGEDTDWDGLTDGEEFSGGHNPLETTDSDGDGIPDGFDPAPQDSFKDFADSDGDGIPDDIDPEPETASGFRPIIEVEGMAGVSNYVEGEEIRISLRIEDPDGGAISSSGISGYLNGSSLSSGGYGITDRGNGKFEISITAESNGELRQFLSISANDADGARNWSDTLALDIAEVELPVTLIGYDGSSSPTPGPLAFNRHLNGKVRKIESYNAIYRGPATFDVEWDGAPVQTLTVDPEQTSLGFLYLPDGESREFDASFSAMSNRQMAIVNLSDCVISTLDYGQVGQGDSPGDHVTLVGTTSLGISEMADFDPIGDISNYTYDGFGDPDVFFEAKSDFGDDGTNEHILISLYTSQSLSERTYHLLFPPVRSGSIRLSHAMIREQVNPVTITPYETGTIGMPGNRKHPLNNHKDFNWMVRVNDDFDEGNVAGDVLQPDYADESIGENDDDIAMVNIKVDPNGATGLNQLFIEIPLNESSDPILNLYAENDQQSVVGLAQRISTYDIEGISLTGIMVDMSDSSNDSLKAPILSEDGLDLYFEALEAKINASLAVYMGRDGDFLTGPSRSARIDLLEVNLESDRAASGNYFGEEDSRIDPIVLLNPQSFGDLASDEVDPCDRQGDDPALVVFYEDVVDEDYNVENFDVELKAGIGGLADVFQWEKNQGPDSGILENANMSDATYSNPKIGGLYQFDVSVGEQKIRTSLMLPLAGADITDWFEAEAASIGPWARAHLRATEDANYSDTPFVTRYAVFRTWSLISGAFFDYTLDPVDSEELSPCRRYQSTIRRGGEYGYVTVNGIVIHGSKINLTLWSLFGNHWGYSQYHLAAGGHLNSILRGQGLDSVSATSAIYLGSQLYRFPEGGVSHPSRIFLLRQMQSDEDLIEEKLWPSPYPMDVSKSSMRRPDPDLPTTPNP